MLSEKNLIGSPALRLRESSAAKQQCQQAVSDSQSGGFKIHDPNHNQSDVANQSDIPATFAAVGSQTASG